jgi:hypothetical protein
MNEVDLGSALNAGEYHPDGTYFNSFEEICSMT